MPEEYFEAVVYPYDDENNVFCTEAKTNKDKTSSSPSNLFVFKIEQILVKLKSTQTPIFTGGKFPKQKKNSHS